MFVQLSSYKGEVAKFAGLTSPLLFLWCIILVENRMILYFKCRNCDQTFICSEQMKLPETLICGGGCGGSIELITEEEADLLVERLREISNG